MAEEVQKYGLDATDYYTAIEKIVAKNRQFADSLIDLGQKIQNADQVLNQTATVFKNISKSPDEFLAALKLLGGQHDKYQDKVRLTNKTLDEHLTKVQEVVKVYDTDLMRSVETFVRGEESKQQAIRATTRAQEAALAGTRAALQETRDLRAKSAESSPSLISGFVDEQMAKQAVSQAKAQGALAKELADARTTEQLRINKVLIDQEKLLQRITNAEKIRQEVEQKGRSVRSGRFEEPTLRINRDRIDPITSEPSQYIRSQTSAEAKELINAHKARQKAAEQEVKDLEKLMLQQVRDFEKAEKEKTRIQKQEERERLKVTKEAAEAKARADADAFRNKASGEIRQLGGGIGRAHSIRAAGAAGGISDLIASQQITAQRADQIVKEISQGTIGVYAGAEARVARLVRTFNDAQDKLNKLSTAKTREELNALGGNLDDLGKKAEKSALSLDITWKTVARLFVIQVLHTMVREFIHSIQDAIDKAAQWQIKISEIRTISQNVPLSFDDWARSVRRLSDEFGNPIMDVTAGTYETISNQVARGTDAVNFMNKALKFSAVTGASTADSVNLLSSGLNSFSLNAAQTERVAGVLFKTIDKGRVRADEIANTFGRVGPSAKALGLSIEDVGAALATLTIRGVPPSEAMTLLTNVMNGLVKPSKEMKEFLHDIGVESGEQAVAVNGFANTLSLLEQRSKGASGELGELFTNVRGQRGITIFTGEGLKTFQDNLNAMKDGIKDFNNAFTISQESPGKQFLKQINEASNVFVADVGQPFLKTAVDVSNALGGMANVLKTVMSVGKPLLELFIAYKATLILINVAASAKAVIDKAAAIAAAHNAQITATRTAGLIAEGRATAYAAQAEALRTEGLEVEARAMMELVTVEDIAAGTALRTATAMRTQSTAGVLLGNATKSLISLLTNPAFLMTGALAAIGYLYNKQTEWEEAVKSSYATAHDGAVQYYQKITETVEKEVAKQSEAQEKALNTQFSAYVDFGSKVEDLLEKFYDRQKDAATQASDLAKEAIKSYVKTYSDQLSKLEEDHKKTLDNIRKAEEDMDRRRQEFADKEFKRNLRLAEHMDRMNNPNAKGNPVLSNQIDLINQQIARLQGQNATLLQPTGNPRTDAENRERVIKNVQQIDELLTTQAEKRFSIEEERQRIVKQIAELEGKIGDEAKQRIAQDDVADVRKQKADEARRFREEREKKGRAPRYGVATREGHEAAIDQLSDDADEARANQTAAERVAQDRINKQKLDELKTTLANYDASLKNLPTIVDIQRQGQDIEATTNDLLQQRITLLKQVETQQQAAVDKQKQAFEALEVALDRLEKFKLDPKVEIKTTADLDKQLIKFDELVSRARIAGVTDQNLILKFVKQRIALENEGNASISKFREKARMDDLQAARKEIEARSEAQKKHLTDLQKQTAAIAAQIYGIIGGPSAEGGYQQGLFETFGAGGLIRDRLQPAGHEEDEVGHYVGVDLNQFQDDIQKLREILVKLVQMQADAAQGKGVIDPKRVQDLAEQFKVLNDRISAAQYGYSINEGGFEGLIQEMFRKHEMFPLTQLPISEARQGPAGEDLGRLTVGEAMQTTQDQINQLIAIINQTQTGVAEKARQDRSLEYTRNALKSLEVSYGKVDASAAAAAKSFEQLTQDVYKVVTAMQGLKTTLEGFNNTPPAPGVKVPGFAYGGMNTDSMIAAVSPGEFIMNARSTRKFYRQLVQMNRYADGGLIDFDPNFRRPIAEVPMGMASDSGVSVSIGQVVFQGGVSPDYDARQLGHALEREIRRGTINLRPQNEG